MKSLFKFFAPIAFVFMLGFTPEPTPMEKLSKEYCGCVTRLGNIVGDPVEVLTGCLRIFHLGNPNFAAVEQEVFDNSQGEDISLIETNWQTIDKTLDMAFENCNYVQKRVDASQKEEIKAEMKERRKTALVEHREEEIAKEVMDLIFDDRWDELGIYHDRPMAFEEKKSSLKDMWNGFAYTTDLHTYNSKKETTNDKLVFTYTFFQEGREGIALRLQIRFKADGIFEKVDEIWMGS
jgi:hypothetical protein